MISYLQNRGIYPEIISEIIHQGIVYESKNHNNCVFVGRDPSGRERAASIRGIGNNHKLEVAGSDKRFSFCFPASDPNCKSLAVAESPIDELSVASLVKRSGESWRDCHYLSLGGTGPRAMMQFLHDHLDVTQVSLCLDNDKAGLDGIRRLEQAIRDDEKLAGRIKLIYPNCSQKENSRKLQERKCLFSRHSADFSKSLSTAEKAVKGKNKGKLLRRWLCSISLFFRGFTGRKSTDIPGYTRKRAGKRIRSNFAAPFAVYFAAAKCPANHPANAPKNKRRQEISKHPAAV